MYKFSFLWFINNFTLTYLILYSLKFVENVEQIYINNVLKNDVICQKKVEIFKICEMMQWRVLYFSSKNQKK